jgi:hypothetical protein
MQESIYLQTIKRCLHAQALHEKISRNEYIRLQINPCRIGYWDISFDLTQKLTDVDVGLNSGSAGIQLGKKRNSSRYPG